MTNFFLVRWLRDISIKRKLYFTVGIMALLIAVELATLMFSIRTLSSVRTLVSAEGLWSKAQKNAAFSLQKYGRSHSEADYRDYLDALKVPQGDSKSRHELMKPDPDYEVARQGFLQGRVHPDDIDGAIRLLRRFHSIYYINKAIGVWTTGDSLMTQMIATGTALHNEITAPNPSNEKITQILSELDNVNGRLTRLEDDFSFTLGEGSRWLTGLVLKLLLGLVLTVEICGLSLTIFVSRGISLGLGNIITSAEKIAAGDFTSRAKVFSKDEIGTLANAFNDMTGKLEANINALTASEEEQKKSKTIAEKSLAVKEHFLANMSHEIRTPMNAVLGFTQLLEDTKLDAYQKEVIHAMKMSSQTLMTLINDILDYSRLESGRIVLEEVPFDLTGIFEALRVMLQQKAATKKLYVRMFIGTSVPEVIAGDPTRLIQILLNLCDNALKFTDTGGVEISVNRINPSNENEATLEFHVTDTGKGIPNDKLSEIFERFTQISPETTRKYGGTGLGLNIVKGLVELQKGTLAVESKEDVGSTFVFTITYKIVDIKPVNVQSVGEITVAPSVEGNGSLHVLVVEDNPTNQMLMEHVLEKYGITFDLAGNGEAAVKKMKTEKYDLILMDIQMPIMDGYEATRIIRNELKSNIPIIALTAHAMNHEREKCLAAGMNDFISKPFDQKYLIERIKQLYTSLAA